MKPSKAILWTDGSCSHSGHGGWAALIAQWVEGSYTLHPPLTGHVYPATNNSMEMQAAIEGLSFLTTPHHVYLVSDSAYLLNTIRNKWYDTWSEEKVRHGVSYERPNWDLWMQIKTLVEYHDVETIKVRGHSRGAWGDPYNDRVDQLCVAARKAGQSGNTNS